MTTCPFAVDRMFASLGTPGTDSGYHSAKTTAETNSVSNTRTRFISRRQRIPLLVAGLAALGVVAVGAYAGADQVLRLAVGVTGTLAVAAAIVAYAVAGAEKRRSPMWGRALDIFEEPFINLRVAGARARPDQHLTFPVVSLVPVVPDGVVNGDRERPDPSVRTQTHVDPVRRAFTSLFADKLGYRFAELHEILAIGNGAPSAAAGRLALG